MPRFFLPRVAGPAVTLPPEDGRHIHRSLRMRPGDTLTVTDGQQEYRCRITAFEADDTVCLAVEEATSVCCEPSLAVTLYQGLPKGDKMDWIVQKSVELGVERIVPVVTARSIARPDRDSGRKKQVRWQKIAAEAAGQSGRGRIPSVEEPTSFAEAARRMAQETTVVFYEGGGAPLRTLIPTIGESLSLFIGPEGGIAAEEKELLCSGGALTATLGPRILRCETAPLAALSMIMVLSGNAE